MFTLTGPLDSGPRLFRVRDSSGLRFFRARDSSGPRLFRARDSGPRFLGRPTTCLARVRGGKKKKKWKDRLGSSSRLTNENEMGFWKEGKRCVKDGSLFILFFFRHGRSANAPHAAAATNGPLAASRTVRYFPAADSGNRSIEAPWSEAQWWVALRLSWVNLRSERRSTRSGDAQNKAAATTTTTTRGGESEADNFGCLFASRNNSTSSSTGSRQRKKRPCVFPPPTPLLEIWAFDWVSFHLHLSWSWKLQKACN